MPKLWHWSRLIKIKKKQQQMISVLKWSDYFYVCSEILKIEKKNNLLFSRKKKRKMGLIQKSFFLFGCWLAAFNVIVELSAWLKLTLCNNK
jgi:hypothetical protein